MHNKILISPYNLSLVKKLFNFAASFLGLIISLPIMISIFILLRLLNHKPIFFKQKRVGKNGKVFTLIKFRTMLVGAEILQNKYKHLNISDGPTFKIPNDPRYTKFGKFLAKSGLDELPQLINVLRGEMSLVGPRPLPVYEANNLTKEQKIREVVLPGITSSWVINGAHGLKFSEWMKLDRQYVESANLLTDIQILTKTAYIISSIGLRKLFVWVSYKPKNHNLF